MTNPTRHTPGPWHVEYLCGDTLVYAPDKDGEGRPVCQVTPTHSELYEGQYGNANACLIAAAPELLAICKLAYAELDDRYDVDQEGEHTREIPFSGAGELMRKLQTIIAKAEGKG